MNLMADLGWLARRWLEEQQRKRARICLSTLARRSVEDGKLFARLDAGGVVTVPVYEKVIRYLATDQAWPGDMPGDVVDRLALLGAPVSGVRVVIEREVVERREVIRVHS